jgi:hypothetical protein
MTELLHAYLFRVKKSVLFWILVGCFAFYVFINLVVLYRDNSDIYQYYSSNGSFTLTFYQSLIGFYLTGGPISQILTVGSPIGPFSLLGILSFIFVLNFFEEEKGCKFFAPFCCFRPVLTLKAIKRMSFSGSFSQKPLLLTDADGDEEDQHLLLQEQEVSNPIEDPFRLGGHLQ